MRSSSGKSKWGKRLVTACLVVLVAVPMNVATVAADSPVVTMPEELEPVPMVAAATVTQVPEEAVPETSIPEEILPEEPAEEVIPWAPVPASDPVEDTYFDDVAFLGNSRTDGFRLYSGLKRGEYYCATGVTVVSVGNEAKGKDAAGQAVSLLDAMAETECSKIYVMLGSNELGWKDGVFEEQSRLLLERLLADHPKATVVVQSILPVSAQQDSMKSYVNNERIQKYNAVWQALAHEYGCPYLNVAEALQDESGCLPEQWTYDGVHLNRAGCRVWLEYLQTHAI